MLGPRFPNRNLSEERSDGSTGWGAACLASEGVEEYAVEIEEAGPLRAVICCRGAYESTAPMHHYAGYRPLRFATRIYTYAGKAQVRVVHTVIVTCNPRETEVEELGLRVPIVPEDGGTWRIGAGRVMEGAWVPERYELLSQRLDNHFYWEEYEGVERAARAEGERAAGWICAENDRAGVGVALRYMAEEYPKALGLVRKASMCSFGATQTAGGLAANATPRRWLGTRAKGFMPTARARRRAASFSSIFFARGPPMASGCRAFCIRHR